MKEAEFMQCHEDIKVVPDKSEIELYQIQDMIRQLDSLNEKCTQNMNRLNAMMLELKGIVAMVRPKVKGTGWYGDEISVISNENEDPGQLYLDLSKGVEFKGQ